MLNCLDISSGSGDYPKELFNVFQQRQSQIEQWFSVLYVQVFRVIVSFSRRISIVQNLLDPKHSCFSQLYQLG